MNYAIEILKESLEQRQASLEITVSDVMKKVYQEEIDDLETAIHNLEMLEPKTERFEKVGMIPDEGVDQLNDLFKYFGDTFNPEKL